MSGALPLLLANVYHGLVGFAIYVLAARVMPAEEFGLLSLVMAVALAAEELVKLGVPKAASREVARSGGAEAARRALALAMRLNLAAGALAALAFALLSPPLAALMSGPGRGAEPGLWLMLAVAGIDMALFAPYMIHLAALNGQRRFGSQAGLMAAYSTAKAVAICGLIAWGQSAWAGVFGYLAGSTAGSLIGWAWLRRERRRERAAPLRDAETPAADGQPDALAMLRFSAPMALFGLLAALFLNADFVAFKRLAASAELGAGGEAWSGVARFGAEVGYYAAAAHIARMAYFAFLAFGEALFPSVAKSLAHETPRLSADRVRKSLGGLLELLLPATALGLATGEPVAELIFGPGYGRAGAYLLWLLPVASALALFYALASALAAANRPWSVFLAIGSGLALNAGFNFLGGASRPADPPMIALFASAAAIAALLPALFRQFGWRWIPWRHAATGLAAALAVWLAGGAIRDSPAGGGWLIFAWGGLVLAAAWGAQLAVAVALKRLGASRRAAEERGAA